MANLNTAITPAPVITSFTKGKIVASGYTGNVTMTLVDNPSGASLGGTTTVAASGGVATFTDLTLNRSGIGFTLLATGASQGGVTPRAVTSRPFSIPTQLVFTTQPTSVAESGDILPLFTVTARDGAGNTDTSYNGEVTVSLYTGAGDGVLSGIFTRNAISGVADFSGLSIEGEGTFSFLAEGGTSTIAAKPSPKVSNSFSVGILNYTVTSVSFDGGFGFLSPPPTLNGAITPTTLNGQAIFGAFVDVAPNPNNFWFIVDALVDQDFFTSVTWNSITLNTASASTYQQVGGRTRWIWANDFWADSIGSLPITIAP